MNKISFHTDAYGTLLKAFKSQAVTPPSMRLRGQVYY